MWSTVNNVLDAIDGFVWGVPLMVLIVTVHGLTTLDLQAMSFPDSAKIKAF